MASGRIFRVRLNFFSYSLQRLRPRRHVLLSQKLWAPSRWSCKAYKLPFSCSSRKSMFPRPKMIAPLLSMLGPKLFILSLMAKMLLPVACQLVYSWLHCSKTGDIMDLLLMLMLLHRRLDERHRYHSLVT